MLSCVAKLFVVTISVKDEIFGRGVSGDNISLRIIFLVTVELQNFFPITLVHICRQSCVQ